MSHYDKTAIILNIIAIIAIIFAQVELRKAFKLIVSLRSERLSRSPDSFTSNQDEAKV